MPANLFQSALQNSARQNNMGQMSWYFPVQRKWLVMTRTKKAEEMQAFFRFCKKIKDLVMPDAGLPACVGIGSARVNTDLAG